MRTCVWRAAIAALGIAAAGCSNDSLPDLAAPPSIDTELRQTIRNWGVVPILPVAQQNPALVDLGRSLFFDKILSGNRDVSCATCHSPQARTADGLSLAIGTGAVTLNSTRVLGPGRQFTPRNALSLFSVGLAPVYLFWDGRVSEDGGFGRFTTPAGTALPVGLTSLLAAQAMIPVTNRVEMRGTIGDRDVFGNPNDLAQLADNDFAGMWTTTMRRVLSVPAYMQKFGAAFPTVPANQLGFQHAANAIAAFETATFTKTNSGFDRYLMREDNALSLEAKRGALLFFGKARCSQCHNGPTLGGNSFANIAVPQLGPGIGSSAPLDIGRGDPAITSQPRSPGFFFRIATLRNVELSAPYMHNGAYASLEAVVRHYNNVDSAVKSYDGSQLDPSLRGTVHGDAGTVNTLLSSLDGRLRQPIRLTVDEQKQLVAFLKSLTDPSARDMIGIAPSSVPSGLPVP